MAVAKGLDVDVMAIIINIMTDNEYNECFKSLNFTNGYDEKLVRVSYEICALFHC